MRALRADFKASVCLVFFLGEEKHAQLRVVFMLVEPNLSQVSSICDNELLYD